MNFTEIVGLIQIKQYVANAVGMFSIERKKINELNSIMLLIDKKIVDGLLGEEFKEYIGFEKAEEAKAEARRLNSEVFSAVKGRK
jgi:hypothetical protein